MLSIIIPVKNMEAYIKKCMNSILDAQIDNMEIIVIDFGSIDNTLNYLHEYKESFIHVLKNEGGNAATARNMGINYAKGDYISFIDADDWIEQNFYKKAIPMLEDSDADIINSGFRNIKFNEEIKENGSSEVYERVIFNKNALNEFLFTVARGNFNLEVWNKIYRKEFIIKNRIYFDDENGINGEDVYFNLKCILHYAKIIQIEDIMYNHLIRNNSLSRNSESILISTRFCTILEKLYSELLINDLYCMDGFSQVVYSLIIQDIMNYMFSLQDIKKGLEIYNSYSFFKQCTQLVIKSDFSTRERKILAYFIRENCTIILYLIKQVKARKKV